LSRANDDRARHQAGEHLAGPGQQSDDRIPSKADFRAGNPKSLIEEALKLPEGV
jgi:hypothetical protein